MICSTPRCPPPPTQWFSVLVFHKLCSLKQHFLSIHHLTVSEFGSQANSAALLHRVSGWNHSVYGPASYLELLGVSPLPGPSVVGRIQSWMAVGLRSPFAGWLWARGSQLLGAACVPWLVALFVWKGCRGASNLSHSSNLYLPPLHPARESSLILMPPVTILRPLWLISPLNGWLYPMIYYNHRSDISLCWQVLKH